ncbi:MAG: hypothetical protein QF362_05140 [Candidatus Woesearchaeota archaeon]|jgi:hypothetical protein|nr:hypothetical protein [Candidatus Woesearchaeota archaeon]
MKLSIHFFVSLVLMITLYPFYNWPVLYLFIGGFLIDFDHYLYYIIKFRSLNLKKASKYFLKPGLKDVLVIFHTFEFMIVFTLFCLYFNLYLLLTGYLIHNILDYIYLYKHNFFNRRASSLLMWIVRRV